MKRKIPMPNDRKLGAAIVYLAGAREHASSEMTAEACDAVATWLKQAKCERRYQLERRLAGGRPR